MLVSANLGRLVFGCVEASKQGRAVPFLQVNTRWKALDETYKIYMLLHRSDLNILANFRRILL